MPAQINLISADIANTRDNVIIIPCSVQGTVSRVFRILLKKKYGYLVPTLLKSQPLGTIEFVYWEYEDENSENNGVINILFAYSVDGDSSNLELINKIFTGVSEFIKSRHISRLSMPLLGTGAGNLPPVEVFELMIKGFQNLNSETVINLYIIDKTIFNQISKYANALKELEKIDLMGAKLADYKRWFLGQNCLLLPAQFGEVNRKLEFIEKGIWETPVDISLDGFLRSIRPGDLVILYNRRTASYNEAVIVAAGFVQGVFDSGRLLNIAWTVLEADIDFDLKIHSKQLLSKIDFFFLQNVFDDFDRFSVFMERVFSLELLQSFSIDDRGIHIANLLPDASDGEDYLEISEDVMAFAKTIASKALIPPLAIALFGTWGAGKSFFMNKIKENIDRICADESHQAYCKGIVHIHFNSWSYMDSNLWAGIVTQIFESLFSYISENTETEEEKEIRKKLNTELTVTSESNKKLDARKETIKEENERLKADKKKIKIQLEWDIRAIRKLSVTKAIKQLDYGLKIQEEFNKAINSNPSIAQTEKILRKNLPGELFGNPDAIYNEISSVSHFVFEFFTKKRFLSNLKWLFLIVLVVVGTTYFLPDVTVWLSRTSFLFSPSTITIIGSLGVLMSKAFNIYKKLKPTISALWEVKSRYHDELREIKYKAVQEEKALLLKIEHNETELSSISERLKQNEINLIDLNYRLRNTIASEALYSFIEKRSSSDDYHKYQGIIAIIRKDLETLSRLFIGHKKESSELDEFRKKFKRPLERIVLYIDDLDRCAESHVVEVLEAVNLLMAFPLFVVVVGVDPLWIKEALAKKHSQINANVDTVNLNFNASVYLEKIFQIPFHLKTAENTNIREMIKNLCPQFKKDEIQMVIHNANGTVQELAHSITAQQKETDRYMKEQKAIDQTEGKGKEKIEKRSPEPLGFSEYETNQLIEYSYFVNNNPRTIKRFVNTYAIVRAHDGLKYEGVQPTGKEILAIIFLLSILLGKNQRQAKLLIELITTEQFAKISIAEFVHNYKNTPLSIQLEPSLNKLFEPAFEPLCEIKIRDIGKHYNFIRRFSFESQI